MGGMFAGWYALKYPKKVDKLIFMSSVGIRRTPEWADQANLFEEFEGSCLATFGMNVA